MLNSQLINGVMIDWDKITSGSYLRNIEAINGVEHIALTHPVTFFVGENGSGKSTLLEAIAIAYGFNPEGGTRNYNFSTVRGKMILPPHGKEFFTRHGNQFFTSFGKHFFLRAVSSFLHIWRCFLPVVSNERRRQPVFPVYFHHQVYGGG